MLASAAAGFVFGSCASPTEPTSALTPSPGLPGASTDRGTLSGERVAAITPATAQDTEEIGDAPASDLTPLTEAQSGDATELEIGKTLPCPKVAPTRCGRFCCSKGCCGNTGQTCCPNPQVCCNGKCCRPGQICCGGNCVPGIKCCGAGACAKGEICCSGSCVKGTKCGGPCGTKTCASTQVCCARQCFNGVTCCAGGACSAAYPLCCAARRWCCPDGYQYSCPNGFCYKTREGAIAACGSSHEVCHGNK